MKSFFIVVTSLLDFYPPLSPSRLRLCHIILFPIFILFGKFNIIGSLIYFFAISLVSFVLLHTHTNFTHSTIPYRSFIFISGWKLITLYRFYLKIWRRDKGMCVVSNAAAHAVEIPLLAFTFIFGSPAFAV